MQDIAIPVTYCLYARKSTTEQEERQVLSIDSQIKEMMKIAERDNLNIVEVKRESHSSKQAGQRAIYNEMIRELNEEKYNGILTWAPDRLSRNAGDLGSLVDLMDQKKLIHIQTYGQTFSNSPNEKFLLMILCSQAKLENDNKSVNVKRGLRARIEMGLLPGRAPTGYLKEKHIDRKCESIVDTLRAPTITKIFEKVAYEQWSGRKIYNWLKFDMKFVTSYGKNLTLSNIYIILRNPFYCGLIEYPKGSGKLFPGKHEVIVSKELFDTVQGTIKEHIIKSESKEFAFTKMMVCGLCSSGICADEKFKKLKNGGVNRHVYYGCSRSKDRNCKCEWINEPDLIKQFEALIDTIDLDEIGIKEKIATEVNRIKKFQQFVLHREKTERIIIKDVDIRNYAKYILIEGENVEKRELLGCLRGKLVLQGRIVSIMN